MQAIVPVASWASVWSTRRPISCPGTSSPRSRWSSRIVRAREAIGLQLKGTVPLGDGRWLRLLRVAGEPRPDLEVLADPLLEVERAERPLVAIAGAFGDA